MRTIRIHTPVALVVGHEVTLDERASHRLGRVLRRRVGDPVTLFNGDGHEARAELLAVDARACRVRIDARVAVDRESPLVLHLVQAVAKGDKMDWVIQKAVELGVAALHPVLTEHGDVRLDAARADKRRARWQEIVVGACEQCGRAVIPEVHTPVALSEWRPPEATGWMLEPDAAEALGAMAPDGPVALAIGPEGGFGSNDRRLLVEAGYHAVRFGPRVLRTETAGAAALAVLQARYGDLGR
ncbi:16S rRNA (uracil(1498)-N(3))-methyltransferase [Wenzhouxiangella sp. XN79A]|uniref:16S rRNA (uracil(1498)-N(3))-methyltransferase n=1 Tax=Wenzhouxiangella sp. XN79A TaxID=2724193 RepID=UPI00144A7780|nr:16S rRNA (uracil(1498)-N(3))-methyltransferase [Wenzhouxiangella sp. XN79A]NKI35665.1 16S rRNA (uracil(1498)-N(3))-methyltransferase [Wenzhouxiangella sp. XN79A]